MTPRSDDDLGEDVNDLEENNDLETELNECFDIALEECDEEESQLVHELEDISLQDMPPPVGDDDDEDDFEEVRFVFFSYWLLYRYFFSAAFATALRV